MNINGGCAMLIKYMCAAVLLCTLTFSCTDEVPAPADSAGGESGQGTLRFSIGQSGNSRLGYDGEYSTVFSDGDAVGCVIAQKDASGNYTYKNNTLWHYRDGVLVLDSLMLYKKVKIVHNQWWTEEKEMWVNCPLSDPDNKLIKRTNADSEDGLLTLLDTSMDYAFFFYYPYVTDDVVKRNISAAVGKWNSDTEFYRSLDYPNWATNATLTFQNNDWGGTNTLSTQSTSPTDEYFRRYIFVGSIGATYSNGDWQTPVVYAWTACPCFVNRTQTSARQIGNSDFLWVAYTTDQKGKGNINAATATYTVGLTFKKKTAVIEVDCDAPLSDVEFVSSTGVITGTFINLQTGVRSPYETTTDYETKKKNCINTGTMLPYVLPDGRYRLILPPQDKFDCDLNFTLNGTTYTVALEDNIDALQEGKIYIIHINRAGKCTLEINDWKQGYSGMLEEA